MRKSDDGAALAILRWWTHDRSPVVFGLGTGIAWGLASAGSSVSRGFVVRHAGCVVAAVGSVILRLLGVGVIVPDYL